jgi:large subunit ribosomal protein L23
MQAVIKRPLITEKTMKLVESGQFSFEVDKHANKMQIAKMVKDKFNVDPISVKIINSKGVTKQQRRVRGTFQTSGMKKAIVQLKKGQKISIFETESQVEEAVVTTAENEPRILKERKNILRGTKVKVEKGAAGAGQTTQRKVITGK